MAVIRGWIYRGQIHAEVAKKSFGALPPEPHPGAMVEEAERLANGLAARSSIELAVNRATAGGSFVVGACMGPVVLDGDATSVGVLMRVPDSLAESSAPSRSEGGAHRGGGREGLDVEARASYGA